MCQLLGMNSATPREEFATSLFRKFCYNRRNRRGLSLTTDHDDITTHFPSHGCWGLAVYQGRGLRTFLDSKPAEESPIAEMVSQCLSMNTRNMMVASRGDEVSLENIHPFSRELWGIQWTFCHNGKVPKFSSSSSINNNNDNRCQRRHPPTLGRKMKTTKRNGTTATQHRYHGVGDTDSEAIFCAIMNALRSEYDNLPTLPVLHKFLKKLCDEIVFNDSEGEDKTVFNFILGCGQYTMFAYSWPGASSIPDGSKIRNGLHYSVRESSSSSDESSLSSAELSDDSNYDDYNHYEDPIAVITTKTFLTKEDDWKEIQRGELIMFDKGIPYSSEPEMCVVVAAAARGVEQQHREGLFKAKKIADATATESSILVVDYARQIPPPTTIAVATTMVHHRSYLDSTRMNVAATQITPLPLAFAN